VSTRTTGDTPDTPLRFYNTLTRAVEDFTPPDDGPVNIYTCGPTVYRHAHIGNLRSYLMADWLRRVLEARGLAVTQVKNITDVGHMRQDVLDRGEDKVIAAARAEGKTPQDIAAYYTGAFLGDEVALNILPATVFPKATDAVPDMVAMIDKLVASGHAYESGGNVYFAVDQFPGYGKLSGQTGEDLESAGRAEPDPLKRDPRDFALWKAAEPGRELKWPSPWGDGFPGWHIECSAIAAAHLGEEVDFHTGGVDNIFPHHEDEIAQSESAFGHQHVRTWMHGQHLLVDGLKMAKSTGNQYLLSDIIARGFDPLAFRYLCATAHYRTRLNFTLPSLRAAQVGLTRLREAASHGADGDPEVDADALREALWAAAADDLDVPGALAIAWRTARSSLPDGAKRQLISDFDRLLGLDLLRTEPPPSLRTATVALLRERDDLRHSREFDRADEIRAELFESGYEVRDPQLTTGGGSTAVPIAAWRVGADSISSSRDVDSLLSESADLAFTVSITARSGCPELERCVSAVRRALGSEPSEILLVDNGFEDACEEAIIDLAGQDERLRLFRADHFLGSAAARNVTLKQARGRTVIFVDTSVEVTGDLFSSLARQLDDPSVGVVGRWGVTTADLRSFDEAESSGDVDAVEGYLMAFRRDVLREAGFLDEKYRFYRHLDLDYSFEVRNLGYRAVIDTSLPVERHSHVDWEATPPEERDRLSKRNFYRFLHKWGERRDLITTPRR
jgi:cysteinyl-tRNA synthetase